MNKVILITKDILYEKYVLDGKPMWKIAKELGVSIGSVFNYLKLYGIRSRNMKDIMTGFKHTKEACDKIGKAHKGKKLTEETKQKISETHKGMFANPSKYGGHKKKTVQGYMKVFVPTHPRCISGEYVMEHHLIMEENIGGYIIKGNVVHHVNGIRDDNRIENLKLMSVKEHARYHAENRKRDERGRLCAIK